MPKRIYVGNLPFSASETEVRDMFEQYGAVDNVSLIDDRETGRPRGFGFVEMPNDQEADAAINALNATEMVSTFLFTLTDRHAFGIAALEGL